MKSLMNKKLISGHPLKIPWLNDETQIQNLILPGVSGFSALGGWVTGRTHEGTTAVSPRGTSDFAKALKPRRGGRGPFIDG